MGEGTYGIVKPPTKVAKTYDGLRNTLRPILEAIGTRSKTPNQTKVPLAQKQPFGKSLITKTSLSFVHSDNNTSYTPLEPSPRPYVSIPFRTISNLKQKQTIVSETITTSVTEPSNPKPFEPPQIPKTIISEILN